MTNGDQPESPATSSTHTDSTSAEAPTSESLATEQKTEEVSVDTQNTPVVNSDVSDRATIDAADHTAGSEGGKTTGSTTIARGTGPLSMRGINKPSSPAVDTEKLQAGSKPTADGKKKKKAPRPRLGGEKNDSEQASNSGGNALPNAQPRRSKISVPNVRQALPDDVQAEFESLLGDDDFDGMMAGPAAESVKKNPIEDGARVHGVVLKIHADDVFISLGGPDEGVVPFEQFKEEPAIGAAVEVIVRGLNREDGLFSLSLPGGTVEANDWEDLDEGTVVEATVTGTNTGGLECKVGGVKGFIPISQITEYRIEDTSEFVDKKLLCVVTESNARRGNLVLSHRAILERERAEKRQEQLEKIQVGDEAEGTVRSIKDFGAFVDLGGLDGLIHISKLSWERVKHPSEVLEEGQKVRVKIDKIDESTGKISLSYRDLLENPWSAAESDFAVGSIHRGTVTRTATFGCFVRLAPGVEGLVHVSELAHHRVSKVDAFVQQGSEVEVKVLSFDRDSQKIALSIKAAQQNAAAVEAPAQQEEIEEPPREVAVKAQHDGPLRGGNNRDTGGAQFGLRW